MRVQPARAMVSWLLALALTLFGAWPAPSVDEQQSRLQSDHQCSQTLPPQPAAYLEAGRVPLGGSLGLGASGAGCANAEAYFALDANDASPKLRSSGRGEFRTLPLQHIRLQI